MTHERPAARTVAAARADDSDGDDDGAGAGEGEARATTGRQQDGSPRMDVSSGAGATRRRRGAAVAAVTAALALGACSQAGGSGPCVRYDAVAVQVEQLLAGGPDSLSSRVPSAPPSAGTPSAGGQVEIIAVQSVLDQLDRLDAEAQQQDDDTAADRASAAIEDLEARLRDYGAALRSGAADARATAEESLAEVRQSWAGVTRAMKTYCGATPAG
ncbi:hypothetical protein [Puerhibacterium puerhi]|uniref:hypothetical protein n=1 Tax=Puerhibacterium puerhi TaxID=2692623 RepID=UPI001356A834|nr:hypothetical protein [Puerhibacterium puerhi]